jgi:hypothetical protein
VVLRCASQRLLARCMTQETAPSPAPPARQAGAYAEPAPRTTHSRLTLARGNTGPHRWARGGPTEQRLQRRAGAACPRSLVLVRRQAYGLVAFQLGQGFLDNLPHAFPREVALATDLP